VSVVSHGCAFERMALQPPRSHHTHTHTHTHTHFSTSIPTSFISRGLGCSLCLSAQRPFLQDLLEETGAQLNAAEVELEVLRSSADGDALADELEGAMRSRSVSADKDKELTRVKVELQRTKAQLDVVREESDGRATRLQTLRQKYDEETRDLQQQCNVLELELAELRAIDSPLPTPSPESLGKKNKKGMTLGEQSAMLKTYMEIKMQLHDLEMELIDAKADCAKQQWTHEMQELYGSPAPSSRCACHLLAGCAPFEFPVACPPMFICSTASSNHSCPI
jgi:hypothetical protein